ncbi:glycosyltransferase [Candidatus Marinimicrobia bacterium]|nr:glycosyltransferase [Candidatus Neomarinimicrobiota bacterium]
MQHSDNKIKLIIITPTLKIGGSQRVITYLCNNLDSKIFDITLIIINNQNSSHSFSIESMKDIKIIDFKITKVRYSLFKIIKATRKIKPDIIFSTQYHLNAALVLIKPFIPSKSKLIARETNIPSIRNFKYKIIYMYFFKRFYKYIDTIVCQSKGMHEEFIQISNCSKNKLVIINNPIDCNFIQKKIEENENEYYKSNIVAIGSTLGHQKGFERLIDSFSFIKDKNVKLIILGEGPSRRKLQNKIDKAGLQNQINLVGCKKDPIKFLKRTDVFALSSFSEGFPNAMLEAGLCGVPTVAFDVKGGIKDIMVEKMNGFTVPEGELELFAETLVKAINYPFDSDKMKDHIVRNFDVSIIIKHYESLFLNIHNNKKNIYEK